MLLLLHKLELADEDAKDGDKDMQQTSSSTTGLGERGVEDTDMAPGYSSGSSSVHDGVGSRGGTCSAEEAGLVVLTLAPTLPQPTPAAPAPPEAAAPPAAPASPAPEAADAADTAEAAC